MSDALNTNHRSSDIEAVCDTFESVHSRLKTGSVFLGESLQDRCTPELLCRQKQFVQLFQSASSGVPMAHVKRLLLKPSSLF